MTILSTDLIPDFLIVLESALTYDGYGYYTSNNSTDYITRGKSIRTVGNTWTVSSKKKVKGVEIKCTAADTWTGAPVTGTWVVEMTSSVGCIACAVCFGPHPPARRVSSTSSAALQRFRSTVFRILWENFRGYCITTVRPPQPKNCQIPAK